MVQFLEDAETCTCRVDSTRVVLAQLKLHGQRGLGPRDRITCYVCQLDRQQVKGYFAVGMYINGLDRDILIDPRCNSVCTMEPNRRKEKGEGKKK